MVVIAILTVTITACQLELGEKAQPPADLRVSENETQCLHDFGKTFGLYFDAQLTDSKVQSFFSCVSQSLKLFQLYVSGADENGYRPEEIQQFLQRHFLRDKVLREELVNEFMEIKPLLVGGPADFITKSEFSELIRRFDQLSGSAVRLNRYMPQYNFDVGRRWVEAGKSLPNINKARDQLLVEARQWGAQFEKTGYSYDLHRLDRFLQEIRIFADWQQSHPRSNSAAEWAYFIRSFKSFTIGAPADDVLANEWPLFFESIARWYGLWSSYAHQLRQDKNLFGNRLERFEDVFAEAFYHLGHAVDRQRDGVVTEHQLNDIVSSMANLNFFGEHIRAESLLKLIRPVIRHGLAGDFDGRVDAPINISRLTVVHAQKEFYLWAGIQDFIFRMKSSGNGDLSADRWSKFGAGHVLSNALEPTTLNEVIKDIAFNQSHLQELQRVTGSLPPLFKDLDPRVTIVPDSERRDYNLYVDSYYNLSVVNLLRSLARLIILTYGEDPVRAHMLAGITSQELENFMSDFKDLAWDLSMVHPASRSPGHRSFMEGNMFTSVGNGMVYPSDESDPNSLLVYHEGIELLSFLLSSGTVSKELYPQLLQKCGVFGTSKDIFGLAKMSKECVLSNLINTINPLLGNLPGMQGFLVSLSPGQRDDLTNILYSIAKRQWNVDQMEYAEVGIISMIFHYVESIMIRHDKNRDGWIDAFEAEEAVPIFAGLIKKMGTGENCAIMSDRRAKDVFLYILENKHAPVTPWQKFDYFFTWNFNDILLDRMGFFQIFLNVINSPETIVQKPCTREFQGEATLSP